MEGTLFSIFLESQNALKRRGDGIFGKNLRHVELETTWRIRYLAISKNSNNALKRSRGILFGGKTFAALPARRADCALFSTFARSRKIDLNPAGEFFLEKKRRKYSCEPSGTHAS